MKKNYKSIALTVVAIFLIGLGYFNFNVGEDSLDIAYTNNSEKTGDVELVSSTPVENQFETAVLPNDEVENTNSNLSNEKNIVVEQSQESKDKYFSESRIERDKMYSQMLEQYQEIVNNNQISSEQKSIAITEIDKITKYKTGTAIAENLIKNKGFQDVVIFSNNNSISVIIKSNVSLTNEQIAQIQNIVSRELDVDVNSINISNK